MNVKYRLENVFYVLQMANVCVVGKLKFECAQSVQRLECIVKSYKAKTNVFRQIKQNLMIQLRFFAKD